MDPIKRLFGASTKELRPGEVQLRLQGKAPPLVLDLRQPQEYQASHIPGATPLPFSELSRQLSGLPRDRDIICVCSFGSNSDSVAQLLARAGFKSINMSEGMLGWQRAGLPVRKGAAE